MAGYPTGDDVKKFLQGAGLPVPSAALLDQSAAFAAAEFETLVSWSPYLASTETTSRRYDPPEWDGPLDLRGAWVEVTEVLVGVSATYAGTALTEGTDYLLSEDGDELRFLTGVSGGLMSVQVTGRRGKVLGVPSDVFQAVLGRAAVTASSSTPSGDGPLKKRTQGPVTFEYATDAHLDRFSRLTSDFTSCAARHKRMAL